MRVFTGGGVYVIEDDLRDRATGLYRYFAGRWSQSVFDYCPGSNLITLHPLSIG